MKVKNNSFIESKKQVLAVSLILSIVMPAVVSSYSVEGAQVYIPISISIAILLAMPKKAISKIFHIIPQS